MTNDEQYQRYLQAHGEDLLTIPPARLDEIADEFGMLAASARQKKRHVEERESDAERLRTRGRSGRGAREGRP